jgi:hypothetical protein
MPFAASRASFCIIGYGFRDSHINVVLLEAVNRQRMKFFLIDPAGAELYPRGPQ